MGYVRFKKNSMANIYNIYMYKNCDYWQQTDIEKVHLCPVLWYDTRLLCNAKLNMISSVGVKSRSHDVTQMSWLNRLFRRRSNNASKLSVAGLCEGNPPVTNGFPSQRASNAGKCFHLMTSSCFVFESHRIFIGLDTSHCWNPSIRYQSPSRWIPSDILNDIKMASIPRFKPLARI